MQALLSGARLRCPSSVANLLYGVVHFGSVSCQLMCAGAQTRHLALRNVVRDVGRVTEKYCFPQREAEPQFELKRRSLHECPKSHPAAPKGSTASSAGGSFYYVRHDAAEQFAQTGRIGNQVATLAVSSNALCTQGPV